MKYNGGLWENVGSAGFSAGSVEYTSVAIDGSGTPYVVYQDGNNRRKATVKKYNGSSWVNVGSAGFSAGTALYKYSHRQQRNALCCVSGFGSQQ